MTRMVENDKVKKRIQWIKSLKFIGVLSVFWGHFIITWIRKI